MYNITLVSGIHIVILHLYTLRCGHYDISSNHVTVVLLTIFPVLYTHWIIKEYIVLPKKPPSGYVTGSEDIASLCCCPH